MRSTLSAKEIADFLHAPIEVQVLEEVGSTNTEAKARLAHSAKPPFLLLAESQTEGRGRLGRSFCSPRQAGLYMSLALDASRFPEAALSVTAAAAVAVCLAIESLTPLRPQIKWVNDVYLGDKKLCGILTEGVLAPTDARLKAMVIGIGVNCNAALLPPEVEAIATSLEQAGAWVDRNCLAAAICDRLWELYQGLPQKTWLAPYRARFWLDQKAVTCTIGDRILSGIALGIDDSGALLVATEEGTHRLFSGEATVRKLTE